MKLAFVERKLADPNRIEGLLETCRKENFLASQGPVHRLLRSQTLSYSAQPQGRTAVPVANGCLALEATARLRDKRLRRRRRRVASVYSFQRLGRGYFSGVLFCDCDAGGVIDLNALAGIGSNRYDSITVTNPFSLHRDFSTFAEFVRHNGKVLLVDNAAGSFRIFPIWTGRPSAFIKRSSSAWGEGGLALVPEDSAGDLYDLIRYG